MFFQRFHGKFSFLHRVFGCTARRGPYRSKGSGSGFVIFALLFEMGAEQLTILDGSPEEENADKKVFHKKPGIKMIQNAGALQGRVNTRGTEEQLVG